MDASSLTSILDRLQRVSRNAEKTLALECKKLQSKLENLPEKVEESVTAFHAIADCVDEIHEKLEGHSRSKEKFLCVCKHRIHFFLDGISDNPDRLLNWLLCDYLCRRGFLESATTLARSSGLDDLIDIGIFEQHYQILNALKCRNINPALRWCQLNKSRLLSTENHLEIYLRLREFIQLVKTKDYAGAIQYLRSHLASVFEVHTELLKRHLGLLAVFDQITAQQLNLYSDLLDDSYWKIIQTMFSQTFFQMHKLSTDPHLDLYLKTGLRALKSQSCGTPSKSISNCPVCSQDVVELAAKLQAAPKSVSSLVCRITGDIMDELNPPMVVPNGQVYSKAGLHAMALVNGGHIRCPETGARFNISDCKNVFVL